MANNTDALLTPSMPHSPQAEQAVLGSMLIDADCVKDVMDKLQAQDFYLRTNREIFETIYHMFVYSQPIDGVTVAGELEKNGLYNDNTRSYLLQLMEVTPTSANVMEYVRIVQDKSLMRQVAQAAGNITAMVQEGGGAAGVMLEAAEQQIYAIRRGRSAQGMVTVGMVLGDVMSQLAELSANGGRTVPGLSTGLSAVDAKINGMNKSDLRESGAIEQDADIVMFLYRDDYYNSDAEKRNVAECIVAKNRHGETGKVELRWMPEYTAFGTLETRYDEDE